MICEYCNESFRGNLYVYEMNGFCAKGSLVIIADNDEERNKLLKETIKNEHWDGMEFELVFEDKILYQSPVKNQIISNTLDMA